MDIDLEKVIGYSRDSLKSRALMRSIMQDLYPDKTREMNVLLSVYESGVPRKIKKDGNITDAEYAQYVQKIIDEYGMQEQWAVAGLNAWIDVCIARGRANGIKYQESNAVIPSAGNYLDGKVNRCNYTNPIVHNNRVHVNNTPDKGDSSDYEIAVLNNGTIEIKKFLGFDQATTVIPTEINGKKVVGIGLDAYKQCKGIRNLIIPEGIEYISEGAFAECENLSQVIFPTSLKELGREANNKWYNPLKNGAFQGTDLKEIDLPNGITEIGKNTFENCKNLSKILFSDNLKIIKSWAFSGCDNLREVILPTTVEKLECGAFSYCKNLTKVILNDGLREIESFAFNDDPVLTLLVIPKSVDILGDEIIGSDYRNLGNITIGCYSGSKAIEYARTNNFQIKNMSK